MPFGDTWTAPQQRLIDVVMGAWIGEGSWPTYDFVASQLDGNDVDAAAVLRSFPFIGEGGVLRWSYSDVRFERMQPRPADNSEIALTVLGLSRHQLGGQAAQAFLAVLRLAAEGWKRTPSDPKRVVEFTLTSEEAIKHLDRVPSDLILRAGSLMPAEPLVGVRSTGRSPDGNWTLTVGRESAKYLNLDLGRYLAVVTQLVEPMPATRDPASAEPGASPSHSPAPATLLHLPPRRTAPITLSRMDLSQAFGELSVLLQESKGAEVRRRGPVHEKWKSKARLIMERSLGRDASVLSSFNNVRYSADIWTGAPGEDEQDKRIFAAGVDTAAAYIEVAMYEIDLLSIEDDPSSPTASDDQPAAAQRPGATSIFIVHGHDGAAKHEVARFVRLVTDIEPIILDEKASGGQTIIEKFETHAGSASFAIVLLTPDDVGRVRGAAHDADCPRARQNVVFELGYFFGKLGRGKVAVINRGVEEPSDVNGLVYISYPNGNWKVELGKELRAAGIGVDMNRS